MRDKREGAAQSQAILIELNPKAPLDLCAAYISIYVIERPTELMNEDFYQRE